jgi:hypothetical protein
MAEDFDSKPDEATVATAEEVLRRIYGDDLTGCPITLDATAQIIHEAGEQRGIKELLDLYEKLVDAIHLLSTAPEPGSVKEPGELQALLGQRLDTIHSLTAKALKTTAPFRKPPSE